MTNVRAEKVAIIAQDVPEQEVNGSPTGDVLVISWGGTYGACTTAVEQLQAEGHAVAHAHLRYLNPFPRNLGELIAGFKKVIIPELNMGQLRAMIRATYMVDAIGLNKVEGKPFSVREIVQFIKDNQ